MEKNDKKVINAWCSYDIANSAYNLIITATLFPVYYQETTKAAFGSDNINFLGFQIQNTVLYDYVLSFAYLIIIILSPLLSGIADYSGHRKRFMQFFTFLGAFSCISLFAFTGSNLVYGLVFAALAVIGYSGSLVYYNSFLPIIASKDRHDRLSARGFAWGYAGSVILLILCLVMINKYEYFGFAKVLDALRFSFLIVGFWWVGISQIAFYYLKDNPCLEKKPNHSLLKGFREINKVFSEIKHQSVIKPYLLAFFMISIGVQTIMLVATMFGKVELGIESPKLIAIIVLLQVVAIVGSKIFAEVSARKGNKISLLIMLIIWIIICFTAYFIKTENQFFILAAFVGLVMGGIQSQSRSTYAKLIPENSNDTASYFSFYDITEKAAIVLGLFFFGFIEHITGSMRLSALLLDIFFVTAFVVMLTVKLPHASRDKKSS